MRGGANGINCSRLLDADKVIHSLLMPVKHQCFRFSSNSVGSWFYQDGQILPAAAAGISMETSFRCNWGTKSAVRRLRRHVLQIRKAGSPAPWSWMEMPSQGPFNMNTGLTATLRPGRELAGICCKQTSTWKWQNVWNPAAGFRLRFMRGADFPPPLLSAPRLPKPNLLSVHLKFRKCVWMITFTHTAFDLLPPNYHKAVQKGTSRHFLFCATVIAFFILGGEEYWYGSSDLISHMSSRVTEGGSY